MLKYNYIMCSTENNLNNTSDFEELDNSIHKQNNQEWSVQSDNVYEAGDIIYDINSNDNKNIMLYFSDIRQKYTKLKKKIRLANHKKMKNNTNVKLYNLKNDLQKLSNNLDDLLMSIDEEGYYKLSTEDMDNLLTNHIANKYVEEHIHNIVKKNICNRVSYCQIL